MDNKNEYTLHPTAIVSPNAQIGEGCIIGPYCVVGSDVKLANNVTLISHVVVDGDTFIDEGTTLYPYVSVGLAPQDLKYSGEKTKVIIGKNNRIREHSTIHLGTNDGIKMTVIGDNCLLMVNAHIAHDVVIGNNVIIANNVLLAGHVVIEDNVSIGGGTAIHQFCRIGTESFVGGLSGITADVVPYSLFTGIRDEAEIMGVNLIGLKRRNYNKEQIKDVKQAFNIIFSKRYSLAENITTLKEVYLENPAVAPIIKFLDTSKGRPLFSNMKGASQPEVKKPFMYKAINKLLKKYL